MADPVYHSGCDGKAWFKPDGAAAALEGDVNAWTLRITSNNKDVSGSKSKRRRIKGCDDASGTVNIHYDSANVPADDTPDTGFNLRAGSVLDLDLAPTGAVAADPANFRLTVIVDEVNYSSEFDGIQEFNISWSLADGTTLKYPSDT